MGVWVCEWGDGGKAVHAIDQDQEEEQAGEQEEDMQIQDDDNKDNGGSR